MKFNGRKDMVRLIVVVLAAFLLAVNIKTVVRAGHLFPGGATGITVLIQQIFALFFGKEVPYSPINILLNAIPVYIGWRYIGKKFTLYSLLMIVLNGIFVDMLPPLTLTYDYLLISVFGGIINGVAISMCLMVGATSGGTDFLAIFFSKRRGVDSFNMILGINVLILVTAGLLFGWERALYSIIFQYVSTQVLHLLYRNYQQQTLFIVTNKADEVCAAIDKVCHHGATIMQAEGSYEHSARAIVYSVVSGGENKAVKRLPVRVESGNGKRLFRVVSRLDGDCPGSILAVLNSDRTNDFDMRPRAGLNSARLTAELNQVLPNSQARTDSVRTLPVAPFHHQNPVFANSDVKFSRCNAGLTIVDVIEKMRVKRMMIGIVVLNLQKAVVVFLSDFEAVRRAHIRSATNRIPPGGLEIVRELKRLLRRVRRENNFRIDVTLRFSNPVWVVFQNAGLCIVKRLESNRVENRFGLVRKAEIAVFRVAEVRVGDNRMSVFAVFAPLFQIVVLECNACFDVVVPVDVIVQIRPWILPRAHEQIRRLVR